MPKVVTKHSKSKQQEEVAEEIKLSPKTKLRISSFRNEDGDIYLNFRKFYKDKEGEWKHASQGMTLPLELAKAFRIKTKTIAEGAEDEAILLQPKSKKGK